MAEIHAHNGDDTFMFCTEGGPAVRSVSIEDLASLPSPLLAPVHCKGAFKTLAQLWNPSYILSKVDARLITYHTTTYLIRINDSTLIGWIQSVKNRAVIWLSFGVPHVVAGMHSFVGHLVDFCSSF